jgi:hypothetical protein
VGSLTCGENITATVHVQEGAADLGNVPFVFPTGTPSTALAQSFDGVTVPALPAGWTSTSESGAGSWATVNTTPDTAPNAAFINDPSTASLTSLVSPQIALPTTSQPIALGFRHSFDFESGWDGGVLELKVGAGGFMDLLAAGGSFATGGYTHTLGPGSTLSGRGVERARAIRHGDGEPAGLGLRPERPAPLEAGQRHERREHGLARGHDHAQAGRTCCAPLSLSIDDVSVAEGAAGTTAATFTVSLSAASGGTVTVECATRRDGHDREQRLRAVSRTLTFDAGSPRSRWTSR